MKEWMPTVYPDEHDPDDRSSQPILSNDPAARARPVGRGDNIRISVPEFIWHKLQEIAKILGRGIDTEPGTLRRRMMAQTCVTDFSGTDTQRITQAIAAAKIIGGSVYMPGHRGQGPNGDYLIDTADLLDRMQTNNVSSNAIFDGSGITGLIGDGPDDTILKISDGVSQYSWLFFFPQQVDGFIARGFTVDGNFNNNPFPVPYPLGTYHNVRRDILAFERADNVIVDNIRSRNGSEVWTVGVRNPTDFKITYNALVGTITVGQTVTQAVTGATGLVTAHDTVNKTLQLDGSSLVVPFNTSNTITSSTGNITAGGGFVFSSIEIGRSRNLRITNCDVIDGGAGPYHDASMFFMEGDGFEVAGCRFYGVPYNPLYAYDDPRSNLGATTCIESHGSDVNIHDNESWYYRTFANLASNTLVPLTGVRATNNVAHVCFGGIDFWSNTIAGQDGPPADRVGFDGVKILHNRFEIDQLLYLPVGLAAHGISVVWQGDNQGIPTGYDLGFRNIELAFNEICFKHEASIVNHSYWCGAIAFFPGMITLPGPVVVPIAHVGEIPCINLHVHDNTFENSTLAGFILNSGNFVVENLRIENNKSKGGTSLDDDITAVNYKYPIFVGAKRIKGGRIKGNAATDDNPTSRITHTVFLSQIDAPPAGVTEPIEVDDNQIQGIGFSVEASYAPGGLTGSLNTGDKIRQLTTQAVGTVFAHDTIGRVLTLWPTVGEFDNIHDIQKDANNKIVSPTCTISSDHSSIVGPLLLQLSNVDARVNGVHPDFDGTISAGESRPTLGSRIHDPKNGIIWTYEGDNLAGTYYWTPRGAARLSDPTIDSVARAASDKDNYTELTALALTVVSVHAREKFRIKLEGSHLSTPSADYCMFAYWIDSGSPVLMGTPINTVGFAGAFHLETELTMTAGSHTIHFGLKPKNGPGITVYAYNIDPGVPMIASIERK